MTKTITDDDLTDHGRTRVGLMGVFERWSQRTRVIDSVNRLTGAERCTDAVVVHERPRWVWLTLLLVVPVFALGVIFNQVTPFLSFIVTLVMVLGFNLPGRRWVLARSGPSVLLAESPRLWPKATRIVAVAEAPMDEPDNGGFLTRWFQLFDRRVVVGFGFAQMVRRIIS